MLKTIIIGHIGNDAKIKNVQENQNVITFSVCHNYRNKNETGEYMDTPFWVNCVLWRKNDKLDIAKHLKKGVLVHVEGEPIVNFYVGKIDKLTKIDYTINASEINILQIPKVSETAKELPKPY